MKNLPLCNLLLDEWLKELEKSEGQQAEDLDIPINT